MSVIRPVYPFSALVGQERLKLALILNTINFRIGGVLIRGEKGTAKSTAVRGLARLLPQITVVEGCPFSCLPTHPAGMCTVCRGRSSTDEALPTIERPIRLVELPVSASEDRVVGSLDLEHALTEGERRFEPGLLAQVNRGLLYVDEVNLLDDHLVDVLLDAAAMGVNTVEREGISISHPARFILVGTMNPEEGDLRPQLLDRFGLAVDIVGLDSVEHRVAVIERRMAYESDPAAFMEQWHAADLEIAGRIGMARELLPHVQVARTDMAVVASLALQLEVDGHRADLTILETARTHAAWSGRTYLTTGDIRLAAQLALPHRMRRQPFAEVLVDDKRIAEVVEQSAQAIQQAAEAQGDSKKKTELINVPTDTNASSAEDGMAAQGASSNDSQGDQQQKAPEGKAQDIGQSFQAKKLEGDRDQMRRRAGGRRSRTRTSRKQGRYITSERATRVNDLALDATLREAAPYQQQRRQEARNNGIQYKPRRVLLKRHDLRQKVRVRRTRNAVCFVVDASWSMAAEERMKATKAAILSLLHDAYQRRDYVGLVSFQRTYASVLLPLTNSVELAQRQLKTMPTGGKTPLARGMLTGYEVLSRARQQDPEVIPLLVLITDGQANVAMGSMAPQKEAYQVARFIAEQQIRAVAIDTEQRSFDRGLTRQLAQYLQGAYYHLDDLKDGKLAQMVREQMQHER
ncbi:MAG: magnesium chelatase subunit D family protein [Chloroflexaceae bacterium]|nr:magnesium chelatase subunit D family protein [Chloroflexaceae bacterium]